MRFQQHRDVSCQVFSLQSKVTTEIHAILTETLACVLPGRAKDLSAPLYLGEEKEFLSIIFPFGRDTSSHIYIYIYI